MSTLCHRDFGAPARPEPTPWARPILRLRRFWPGVRELLLIGAFYATYSLGRVLASGDVVSAVGHAGRVLHLEDLLHLDLEHVVNNVFADQHWLGVGASFYYAAGHYVVTPLVLLWLWFGHRRHYPSARRALGTATLVALLTYLALPTAPPRLVGGYHDLLAATSDVGWWSTSASAPRGLGGLTNQLAAMPSMHVGWALWSALALQAYAGHRVVRALGWLHVAVTSAVVVGTGNHWVLDVIAGAGLVALMWVALGASASRTGTQGSRRPQPPGFRRARVPDLGSGA